MYRHHPQWQWAMRVVRGGRIGDIQMVHCCFHFCDDNPAGILHHPEWGGGCLMDIGCYAVSTSRWLFQAEPVQVSARSRGRPTMWRGSIDRRRHAIPGRNGVVHLLYAAGFLSASECVWNARPTGIGVAF